MNEHMDAMLAKMLPEDYVKFFAKFNKFDLVAKSDMLAVADVDWSSMRHHYLTCVNHPWMRLTTKNPFERSVFFLQGYRGLMASMDDECKCSFEDMRVVREPDEKDDSLYGVFDGEGDVGAKN